MGPFVPPGNFFQKVLRTANQNILSAETAAAQEDLEQKQAVCVPTESFLHTFFSWQSPRTTQKPFILLKTYAFRQVLGT